MKTIELKCCCGASLTLRDEATFTCAVDAQAESWMHRHEGCSKAGEACGNRYDPSTFDVSTPPEPDYKGRCERASELLRMACSISHPDRVQEEFAKAGIRDQALAILEGRE